MVLPQRLGPSELYESAKGCSLHHKVLGDVLRQSPLGTDYELKNRYMHIDYVEESNSQSAKQQSPKCQFGTLDCTLEELAVLDLIKKNPTIKQQELADITDKSIRSVKRIMKSLQDKNYIRRESGKRYGKWEVII